MFLTLACVPLFALRTEAAPASAELLSQQHARQAQLRSSTDRVAAQLSVILEDFRLNGISGQDVQRLQVIRSVLQSLSGEDMRVILEALQRAAEGHDPSRALNDALAAYSGQRAVSAKLRAVINEYLRLAEAYELAQRFREFAQRESALMWRTVALAKRTADKSTNSFSETELGELRLLQIEQEPMRDEVLPLLSKLEEVRNGATTEPRDRGSPEASRYARESNLLPALEAATRSLQGTKLHSAAGDQRTARNALREVARLLVLSQGRAAALRQALSDIDHATDGQTQLMAAVEKAESRDANLEPRQAELADYADLIRSDLDSLAPAASQALRGVIGSMNGARQVLDEHAQGSQRRAKALPLQAEALSGLAQARRAVQEQIELAEKQTEALPELMAELQELLKQLRQLVVDQTVLKESTAAIETAASPTPATVRLASRAASQGELYERTQSLQQRAADASTGASQSLGEAAAHMLKAQTSLAAGQNNAMAQQAALDALKRAENQLLADARRVQEAKLDSERLTHLLQRLVAIIETQQRLQFATARAPSLPSVTLDELARQQNTLHTNTALLRNDTAQISPSAASHLGNGHGHMQQAERLLRTPNPETNALVAMVTNAVARQTDALKELYAAHDVLQKQLAGLQEKLGSTNAAGTLDAAAAGIDKARQQLERALSQLQAPPPGLLQSLLQQQQQIVDGLQHLTPRETPHVSLREAQAAAAAAAQGLAEMNLSGAVNSMGRARAAMEQAAAAGQEMDGQVPALAAHQAQVQKLAEALLGTQRELQPGALAEAGQLLADAGEMIGPLAGQGQLPASAQDSLQSAQAALAAAAAQAFAGQAAPAQANAASAAEALANAQSAMALAQAGLNAQMASSGQQGQVPGQGQGTGDGQNAGQPNAMASPNANGNGRTGNWSGEGSADGPRRDAQGQGKFTGLPARERAALLQSQAEKYPQEYGPLIEQYLRNLADEASPP